MSMLSSEIQLHNITSVSKTNFEGLSKTLYRCIISNHCKIAYCIPNNYTGCFQSPPQF